MAAEARYLQPLEVIGYFLDNLRSSHHDLIKHFRPLLVGNELATENHEFLKKITAQLVVVKKIQGSKCLELKPTLANLTAYEILRTLDEEKIIPPRPRSRNPVYQPVSLPNEEDYFLRPPKGRYHTCARFGITFC